MAVIEAVSCSGLGGWERPIHPNAGLGGAKKLQAMSEVATHGSIAPLANLLLAADAQGLRLLALKRQASRACAAGMERDKPVAEVIRQLHAYLAAN